MCYLLNMSPEKKYVSPEQVLGAIYGRSSLEIGMSERRRDEVIAAAIFTSFRNQEFGTRFKLPADFRQGDLKQDAEGIDMEVADNKGRRKNLQVKWIHIQRSITRRMHHNTKGVARIMKNSQKFIKRDSEELRKIMKGELQKITQDYGGIYLIINVSADLATQTSLEIAIRKNQDVVSKLRAKEVWFLRSIPVRAIYGKKSQPPNCHAYELIKLAPDKHTYCFAFAL